MLSQDGPHILGRPFSISEGDSTMKLFGTTVTEPNKEVLVIPRANYDIVLFAQAILSDEEFIRLCPLPKAPTVQRPGQANDGFTEDVTDRGFLQARDRWAEQKTNWVIITSLRATPTTTIEWEKVKYNDPTTWGEWKNELKAAFFTENEIGQIINLCWAANGISQSRLDEARERFLHGRQREFSPPSSPTDEQQTTPSGEPAKDSASALPASK